MNICVFKKYKINYKCNYSYTNEDNEIKDAKEESSFVIEGSQFIKLIAREMSNKNCIDIVSSDYQIIISQFDPNSGEDANHFFKYEETKGEQ